MLTVVFNISDKSTGPVILGCIILRTDSMFYKEKQLKTKISSYKTSQSMWVTKFHVWKYQI